MNAVLGSPNSPDNSNVRLDMPERLDNRELCVKSRGGINNSGFGHVNTRPRNSILAEYGISVHTRSGESWHV